MSRCVHIKRKWRVTQQTPWTKQITWAPPPAAAAGGGGRSRKCSSVVFPAVCRPFLFLGTWFVPVWWAAPVRAPSSSNWSYTHTPFNCQKRACQSVWCAELQLRITWTFSGIELPRSPPPPTCAMLWPIPMWGTNNTEVEYSVRSHLSLPSPALSPALSFPCIGFALAPPSLDPPLQCCRHWQLQIPQRLWNFVFDFSIFFLFFSFFSFFFFKNLGGVQPVDYTMNGTRLWKWNIWITGTFTNKFRRLGS